MKDHSTITSAISLAHAITSLAADWSRQDDELASARAGLDSTERDDAQEKKEDSRIRLGRERAIDGIIKRYWPVQDLIESSTAVKVDVPIGRVSCHEGICTREECERCSRADSFHRALEYAHRL